MTERDRMGRSPLHYAALEGDEDLVAQLIGSGLDVNQADDDGFTPLHFAAQEQMISATRLLLDNGAEIDARDAFGNPALFVAIINAEGAKKEVALLLERGADPTLRNNAGVSPIDLAWTIDNFDYRDLFPKPSG